MRQRIINSNASHRKPLGRTPSLGRSPSRFSRRYHAKLSSKPGRQLRGLPMSGGALAATRAAKRSERAGRRVATEDVGKPND